MSHSISLALAALRVGVGSPKASPRGRYRVGTMRRQASLYLELLAGSCNYLSPGRRGLPCHWIPLIVVKIVGRGSAASFHSKHPSTGPVLAKPCGDGLTGNGDRFRMELEVSSS